MLLTTLSAALALASPCFSQILSPEIDQFVETILTEFNVPGGVGLSVVRQDQTTGEWFPEVKGYGVAKLDGTKVHEDTLFPIGSNSKVMCIVLP